jgi:hypothetical protein
MKQLEIFFIFFYLKMKYKIINYVNYTKTYFNNNNKNSIKRNIEIKITYFKLTDFIFIFIIYL